MSKSFLSRTHAANSADSQINKGTAKTDPEAELKWLDYLAHPERANDPNVDYAADVQQNVLQENVVQAKESEFGNLPQFNRGVGLNNAVPVAKIFSIDLDYFVTGGMDTEPIGFIVVLQGPDVGKVAAFGDIGYIGAGVDISASFKETNLWYTGAKDKFTISTIQGYRREINGAIGYGVDLGLSLSWTKPDEYGGRLIGFGVSVGVSPPMPWLGSGNYNEGNTYIYKVW